MTKVIINKFIKGMSNDPREIGGLARVVKNFDIQSYRHKLVPFRSSETGDGSASTNKIRKFCVANSASGGTGNDYRLYGLGVVSGGTKAKVFQNSSLVGTTWSSTSNNESSTGSTTDFDLFVYYPNQHRIYGSRDMQYIWAYDPDGSSAWADSAYDYGSVFSTITQGLVHSKDDTLYIGIDNKVIYKDGAGSFTSGLTLPTDRVITSLSEYGNYLAIATRPKGQIGNSIVYLWNRDTTLVEVSETIDWGEGNLQILEEVDGRLIGISILGTTSSTLLSKIIFKYYTGSSVEVISSFTSEDIYLTNDLMNHKQKVNNQLYFLMTLKLAGATQEGLWRFGKNEVGDPYTLSLERTPNNDTALASTKSFGGFFKVGDIIFISYQTSSAWAMSKTDSSTNYTATSIFETTINPEMPLQDRTKRKQLKSISVSTEPLETDSQVVLKYKVDGGAYATIFTETTDSNITTEKAQAFPRGREYQFRIESTGGAEITELKYDYDIIETQI